MFIGSEGRRFVLGRERISRGLLLMGVVIPKLNVNILPRTGGPFTGADSGRD